MAYLEIFVGKKEILLDIKIESNLPQWISSNITKNFGKSYLKKIVESLL